MQQMWKRSLAMFLAIVMVLGNVPVSAFAEEVVEEVIVEEAITEAEVYEEVYEEIIEEEIIEEEIVEEEIIEEVIEEEVIEEEIMEEEVTEEEITDEEITEEVTEEAPVVNVAATNKVVAAETDAAVVAYIGEQGHETIQAAIDAAQAGGTVTIKAGTYAVPTLKAGITIEGEVNADGTPAVVLEGTIKGTLENLTLKNLHVKGGNAQRWAYAKGNLHFENVTFEATSVYALHFDSITEGANLMYKDCTIIGWAAMSGSPASCVFDGCTIKGNGAYGVIRTYFDATIQNCTFDVANVNTTDVYQDGIHAVGATVTVEKCTNVNGDMKDLLNISEEEGKIILNGVQALPAPVAYIGTTPYMTLADAVKEAPSGATITLMNGEYELPLFAGKELTFKGESKDGVIVNDAPAAVTQGWNGSTFHFENLTAKGAAENYHGLANGVVAVTYKDCNINGLRFLYAPATFTNCAFNANGVEHSFWTYGSAKVVVTECSFTYTDRAVNCYSENGAEHEANVTFTDCSFTYAGTADAPEGAVEINSGSSKSFTLDFNNCTAPAKGAMWFNSQWDSKGGANTVVMINGNQAWPKVAVEKPTVDQIEITTPETEEGEDGPAPVEPDQAQEIVDQITENKAVTEHEPENVPEDAVLVIELTKVEAKAEENNVITTKVTFDVAPYRGEDKVENDELTDPVKFRLPLPASFNAGLATITHYKEDGSKKIWENVEVKSDDAGNKYVEVEVSSFSGFEVAGQDGYIVPDMAKIGNTTYKTFEAALNAVQDGETITLLNVEGAEMATEDKFVEIDFTKDISFTITGEAPNYALPIVTFQNATVNIRNANIKIPELDARQNATINVVDSIVHDAGGDSIVKSYYNGAINISGTSVVYTMQVTTMGTITISDTAKLTATWQTNVYGNGLITVEDDATFNTAGLNLTGKDYEGRDNTDADRVGKAAEIKVDGATFIAGKAISEEGADYSYNADEYGLNIGTIADKKAVLNILNNADVQIYTGSGKTGNIGADGTVNVDGSKFTVACRDANGTSTLVNSGLIDVKGYSSLNIPTLQDASGKSGVVFVTDNTMLTKTTVGGSIYAGYGANKTDSLILELVNGFSAKALYVGDKTVTGYYTNGQVHTLKATGTVDIGSLYVRPTCEATFTKADVNLGDLLVRGTMDVVDSEIDYVYNVNGFGGTGHWAVYEDDDTTRTAALNLKDSTVNGKYLVVGSNSNEDTDANSNAKLTIEGGSLALSSRLYLQSTSAFKNTIEINGAKLSAESAFISDNATVNVNAGESTLNIATLSGNSIDLNEGAIVKDSTVGGAGYVAGNVVFRGNNTFTMLTDYGDFYSKETPSMWTVEKGGSLTLTKNDRYGLGYGDQVTIYGELEEGTALTARKTLTDADADVNMYGGLVGMTNSAAPNANNKFIAENAYMIFGVKGDKSFGNKPGHYSNYEYTISNSVMTANGFKFYEDQGSSTLTMNGSDLLVNGVFMTNDASSKFTLTDSVIVSKAVNNGSDDKNQNAGELTLNNTDLTYNADFTNIGTVTIDKDSSLTAPSVSGTGKLVLDVDGMAPGVYANIDADMSGYTGEIVLEGKSKLIAGYKLDENGKVHLVGYVAEIDGTKYTDLQEAIKVADGKTVTLLSDVTLSKTVNIPEGKTVTLDLKDYTITGTMHKDDGSVLKNEGTLTLKNGTVKSTGDNGGSALINSGSATVEMVTLNGAPQAGESWPSYTVNNTGTLTLTECALTSNHGTVASYGEGAQVTLDGTNIDMTGILGFTNHALYTYNNGKITVNSGTIANNAADQASTGGSVINGAVTVNGGTFTGRIENYYGTPVLKGGTFSENPTAYVVSGYGAEQNEEGAWVVAKKTTLTLAEFVALVEAGNGTYDGKLDENTNITVQIEPASGDARVVGHDVKIPDRLQKYGNPEVYYAQYQRFAGLTNVSISNVNFVFVPAAVTVMDAWNTAGATTTAENINGELQLLNTGSVTLTGCTFNKVSVSPINATTNVHVSGCTFENLNAYAIKDIKANIVTVTGSTFTNCNGGFWLADAPGSLTVTDNTFTGVGRRGAIQFSATGDYSETAMSVTGNIVNDGALLWQLNTTVPYDKIDAILENNTYKTAYVDGSVMLVAAVEDAKFYTLQEAINVADGKTVKLLSDVTLTETVTIPAGTTSTLDLAGKTVSMVYAQDAAANHTMVENYGDLTIMDSVGDGKLSYQYTGSNLGTTYSANTVTTEPGSVLTVKGGTIENLTYDSGIIAYAIDGLTNGTIGDVTVNIEGGTITSLRQSVRIFANSTTHTGTLNITGGTFTGRVIVQNASAKANKAVLKIEGGTFNANAYKNDVLYVGGSESATIAIDANVSGGTFNGDITDTKVKGFITGGTFYTEPAADLIAEDHHVIQNENVDIWEVVKDGTLTSYAKSLLFEDIVQIRYYFDYNGDLTDDYVKANGGILVWEHEQESYAPGTESYKVEGLEIRTIDGINYFHATGKGIPAKQWGDQQHACAYLELENGETIYSEVSAYSPMIYAYNMINKESTKDTMRDLAVAMLNYGAKAQINFKYDTNNLMNSDLTADQQSWTWNPSWLVAKTEVDASKVGVAKDAGINYYAWSLLYEGSIGMRMYNKFDSSLLAGAQEKGIMYWKAATYASGSLTANNSAGTVTELYHYEDDIYYGTLPGTAAKELDETVFACAYVKDSNGEYHFGDVRSYSAHTYANNKIGGSNATLSDLCEAMVLYNCAAKAHLS